MGTIISMNTTFQSDDFISLAAEQFSQRSWQVKKLKVALEKTLSTEFSTSKLSRPVSYILDDVLALDPDSYIPKDKSKSMVTYVLRRTFAKLETL